MGVRVASSLMQLGETMSVTKMTVFIGIMCSVRMASPLTANAFDLKEFVGLSDRGSTKVKTCFEDDENRKGGRISFSNKAASGVKVVIDLADGDGLDGDDVFDALFDYGASTTPLFSGVWSKIDERTKGGQIFRETYQLTPSGDLASFPPSGGWKDLLDLISAEVGNACLKAPPIQVYGDLSDFVKGTLVVENKDPKCATTTDDKKKAYNAACLSECAGGSCMKAKVALDVKAFMNDDGINAWAEVRNHWVRFRYKATGYVVGSNPP
jgi:hypothetical protein